MINKTEHEIISTWDYNKYDEPLVAIWSLVYNHEDYLEEAIDSFLSQITTFPFVVYLHDDCSTDKSADIIRKYESLFPSIIHGVYEEENLYTKGAELIREKKLTTINTKYTALCEGDDYWIDSYKLQIQIEYMEGHPECVLTMHNGYEYNPQKNEMERKNDPYDHEGSLTKKEVLLETGSMPNTASMVYVTDIEKRMPMNVFRAPVGDRPMRMYLLTQGDIYYFSRAMSVHRLSYSNYSFTARVCANNQYAKHILDDMVAFYERYDIYTNGKYSKEVKEMISREYYLYYKRIGDLRKAFTTEYYRNHFSRKKRLRIRCSYCVKQIILGKMQNLIRSFLGRNK